jgi:hypothetical protein
VTRPPEPTVWIVDDDLGFVCWLGDIFTEAGFRALPALNCLEGVALVKRMGIEPDLILLNPHLPGVARMLQGRMRAKRHAKIVTIGAPPKALAASFRVHATLERPFGSEPPSRSEWLEKVRKLLRELQARELDGGSIGAEQVERSNGITRD